MDRQHHEIIDLVDRLDALSGVAHTRLSHAFAILDEIMDLTTRHFITEELLMEQMEYPADAMERMLAQHRDFRAYARIRTLEVRSGDHSGLALLPGFLRTWLVEHEFGLDRELVTWIQTRGIPEEPHQREYA